MLSSDVASMRKDDVLRTAEGDSTTNTSRAEAFIRSAVKGHSA